MKITKEKAYPVYISLGLLYFIAKVIFYISDFVYYRGVVLGLVATVLTVCIGVLALREYRKPTRHIMHWLAVSAPLVVLLLTPIIMIRNLGPEIFQIEKIAILTIFGCIAIAQTVLAASMLKSLRERK